LYPSLLKLEQDGFVSSEWGVSENGRRARYYAITRAGKKHLAPGSGAVGARQLPASVPDFEDWAASSLFADLGAFDNLGFNVRIGDQTERVKGLQISGRGFDIFAVPPALGRTFRASDTVAGHEHVAILSDAVWRSRLGADPSVVGRDIVIDGSLHRIVGVLPPNFPRFSHEEIYTPLVFKEPTASDRGKRNLTVVGRVEPRLSLAAAQQRIAQVSKRLGEQFPTTDGGAPWG
jgi:hypothetical protein